MAMASKLTTNATLPACDVRLPTTLDMVARVTALPQSAAQQLLETCTKNMIMNLLTATATYGDKVSDSRQAAASQAFGMTL